MANHDLEAAFYSHTNLDPHVAARLTQAGLLGAHYGELYAERSSLEVIEIDDGSISTSYGESGGFGFRIGVGEKVAFEHSNLFDTDNLRQAIANTRLVHRNFTGAHAGAYGAHPQRFYPEVFNLGSLTQQQKVRKLKEIDAEVRAMDSNITNVVLSYHSSVKLVHIITADGKLLFDTRPYTALRIQVIIDNQQGGAEEGIEVAGGVIGSDSLLLTDRWKTAAKTAVEEAQTLLIAKPAPKGRMDVVLGPGWPAVILHEAVGHGLEGDANRRGTSAFSGRVGDMVAAQHVTIIDRGNMIDERGSLQFDDEGTLTQENVLVQNGRLTGYMQDRQNALLMGVTPTGNGRRESWKHMPQPRMTNTFYANGTYDPQEIIESVSYGLLVNSMAGGQVDTTSGDFNMNANLAYIIRAGKICEPVKAASIIGNGPDVIREVTMLGNDLEINRERGACGKNGQRVNVSVGQPTLLAPQMTIGGV